VFENAKANFSACVADFPGRVATGVSIQEVQREIRKAIECHLEVPREDGDPIAAPSSSVKQIEIAA
jgi:predicted RNase H-like HicB family nuclease